MITAWSLVCLVFALLWILLKYAMTQEHYDFDNIFYETVNFILCGGIIVRLMCVAFEHKAVLSSYIIF